MTIQSAQVVRDREKVGNYLFNIIVTRWFA